MSIVSPMRLSAIAFRIAVFGLAAVGSVFAAQATVTFVEDRSVLGVRKALNQEALDWASVVGDGLQVVLEGEAPTEAARFQAISAAGGIVDASRVIDNMEVKAAAALARPTFAIEILRNESGVSLIGLVPASTDREALIAEITSATDDQTVTDLLEVADYDPPATWDTAVTYAMRAIELLPTSKISVSEDAVAVSGITESLAEKTTLENRLGRNTPSDVTVDVALTAPRPVISPYTTRFILDADGARFDACAVDGAETEAKIIAAAEAAGFTGDAGCIDALGAPSTAWGDTVVLAISAVNDLGGGTVTLADTDLGLIALEGTPERQFDNIVGRLENALPPEFALTADLPETPDADADAALAFLITRAEDGSVTLQGRVPDDLANQTAATLAQAKFGSDEVTNSIRIGEDLPSGWILRVLAGVEAMGHLHNGIVTVTPDTIAITGETGQETASADITALLADKLGEAAAVDLDVTYVKALDPIAGIPTPEECIDQINGVMAISKIAFDPGASSLTADANPVLDEIAAILTKCPDLPMRIAGYTDSQGREEMNLQLSQDRASAVLSALRQRRVPVGAFEAIGFGEENPIADNSTEEGREANRRIAFSLIVPDIEAPTDAPTENPE